MTGPDEDAGGKSAEAPRPGFGHRADVLTRRADASVLDRLRTAGAFDVGLHARSVELAAAPPGPTAWGLILDRLFLALGGALIAAGVVFFFAYNWAAMGRLSKVTVLDLGLVAAVLATFRSGLNSSGGRMTLAVAVVLTGMLLAVQGQSYPTDADSWLLFAMWAALTIPFVVAARFVPLWLLWLVLANIALVLWWQGQPWSRYLAVAGGATLGLVNGLALVTWRRLAPTRPWAAGSLVPSVLSVAIVAPLAFSCAYALTQYDRSQGPGLAVAIALWLGASVLLIRTYASDDLFPPAAVAAGLLVVATAAMSRLFFDIGHADTGGSLYTGIGIVVLATVATTWLARLAKAQRGDGV